MSIPAITCTQCGQPIHVRDGVAYAVIRDGATHAAYAPMRHHCASNTAPAHLIPAWIRDSVEYAAFKVART